MKIPFLDKLLGQQKEILPKTQTIGLLDIIAPPALKFGPDHAEIGKTLARTYFIFSFPRYLSTGWLSPVINLDVPMDISIFMHPIDTGLVLKKLRKKLTEVQSEIMEREEKGLIRDPKLETAYRDIETLRDKLQTAEERMFRVGLYITIYAETKKELDKIEGTLRTLLESKLVYIKPALYQQDKGFTSTSPYGVDRLQVHTPMNTSPLSTMFPFISFDLSSNEGILYGINQHNNSLVLFDRFTLENANMVVFGKSGGGKSIKGNETVLIKENGSIKREKIGHLVDRLIKKYGSQKIDKELEGVINPPIEVWSFDNKLKGSWSKVTVAARKEASKTFYKFKTRSGREIVTTSDHNMMILKNGRLVVTKSSEVKKGDYVPLPRKVESNNKSQNLNLLNLLCNSKHIYILGAEKLIEKYYKKLQKVEIDKKYDQYLLCYKKGRRIPLKYFLKILEKLNIKVNDPQLEKIKIVSKNGKKEFALPIKFIISDSFLRLFGLLLAEGVIGNRFVLISNLDKEVIRQIEADFKKINVPFYKTKEGINCFGRVFVEIIKALGGMDKASKKNVPGFIFNLERRQIAYFLSGYFEGDGGVEHNKIAIVSKSKELISDIAYLLYYFGIVARIRKKSKKATNQNWTKKRVYWQLTISGKENLQVFQKEINFLSSPKRKRLQKIISQKGNTNVDVIPNISSLFENLASLAPDLPRGIREISPLKRGVFKPSRSHLIKILEKLENRSKALQVDTSPVFSALADSLSLRYYSQSTLFCQKTLLQVQEILSVLKNLAFSDLFFDEIVEIKKIENKKEKYVYDLTVDNEVFLAGFGGMFVHNSYAVKLEILRYLMLGVDVIVIDPENEYKFLCDAVGGAFYDISLKSPNHINPFDLPLPAEDETPEDVFRSNIINLVGLIRVMLGGLTPEEDALIDQAIEETYAARDITPETDPALWKERTPLLSDLEAVLETMEGAESLTRKLRKFTKGVYAGFFNYPTNITMKKQMVVFGIRNLETELRPMAMYIIMRYIWNTVKREMKKRILVIDEAWWLMQSEDSASFLFGIVKRGRKYWLGTTTITQDVNDFMKSEYGQPIITNSSLQLLMKQSPATIDVVQKTFNLTDEEKYLLLEAPIGEGIFFAGEKHVAIRVVSSYAEHQLITTAPEEVVKIKQMKKLKKNE